MSKVLAPKTSSYSGSTVNISHNSNNNNNNSTNNDINTHYYRQNKTNFSNMKPTPPQTPQQQQECHLDELGYCFVRKCIETIEARGLDDQGLYRIGGVNSRVARLLQICLDRKNYNPATGQVKLPDFSDPVEWETKTITSALKNYLRNLSEPLMTYNLHPSIIEAAKIEDAETRTNKIKSLIQQLPIRNFNLLKILVEHLKNVANNSQKNLMTVSNLGICFAPTLMRGPEENALSIMEIKYSNVVANTLIEDCDSIFNDPRMNQQLHQDALQHTLNGHPLDLINHDDQFGLGLPSHRYQQNHHLSTIQNAISHPDKPFKRHNGGHDLAQFALKSYDQTSRPTTFITNSIPLVDIRPINDLKTYSFDQVPMVSNEQPYHRQHLGESMNNSTNYLGYLSSQTSSYPNSLNYSTNSLNYGPLSEQYNNPNQLNSFPCYPMNSNKPTYHSNKVITLYACVADTESELSFGPNEVITDVRHSAEVGWLVGTLERNGMRGLLPENYVKFI